MPIRPEGPQHRARRLVAAAVRDPAGVMELPPHDLDLTLRLLRRARLLGRLAAALQSLGRLDDLPAVIADPLHSALMVADARARTARWELDRIVWALRDLPEVPLVALKGCAYLLAGTPNARGRTFADVDLLVPEADLARVEARLRAEGWGSANLTPYDERYYRVWAHEIPPLRHPEREVEVDLHHNILMRTARRQLSAATLLEMSWPVPGSRFSVLSPVDMTLHAITHLFYGGEMDDAIRELVDMADLATHFQLTVPGYWEEFWRRSRELGLISVARLGLRSAATLAGGAMASALRASVVEMRPRGLTDRIVDRLVPSALYPVHPDYGSISSAAAREMLYVRSHWVKMRPVLLARHLTYKAWLRVRRRAEFVGTAKSLGHR